MHIISIDISHKVRAIPLVTTHRIVRNNCDYYNDRTGKKSTSFARLEVKLTPCYRCKLGIIISNIGTNFSRIYVVISITIRSIPSNYNITRRKNGKCRESGRFVPMGWTVQSGLDFLRGNFRRLEEERKNIRKKKKREIRGKKKGEKFPRTRSVRQVLRKHSSRSPELCRAISEIGFL